MKRFLIIVGIIILLGGIGSYYYYNYEERDDSIVTIYGNIDIREVDLGFRVFGKLEKMNFEEGDRVKKGTLLATLEKTPYVNAVNSAKADVEQKKIEYDNNLKIAKRKEKLVIDKYISKEETDNAETVRYQSLAALHQSEANLATAETNMKDTEVYSPTDGMILSRVEEPGTILNAGGNVYVLALDKPIWARVYINEPDLGRIYLGMKAKVYNDSHPDKAYDAQVGFISPVAEFTPKTVESEELRTKLVYRLRVIIEKPDRLLRQGMPVTVKLDTKTAHGH